MAFKPVLHSSGLGCADTTSLQPLLTAGLLHLCLASSLPLLWCHRGLPPEKLIDSCNKSHVKQAFLPPGNAKIRHIWFCQSPANVPSHLPFPCSPACLPSANALTFLPEGFLWPLAPGYSVWRHCRLEMPENVMLFGSSPWSMTIWDIVDK